MTLGEEALELVEAAGKLFGFGMFLIAAGSVIAIPVLGLYLLYRMIMG